MKRYQAILFDFDGTLFDSWPAIYDAYLATYLHFYPGKDYSHIGKMYNQHNDYKEAFKIVFKTLEIDAEIDAYLRDTYLELAAKNPILIDGVQEVVGFLEKKSYTWGIVTSKKKVFTESILINSTLSHTYKCLICEEDAKHKKPNPEPLIKACQILKINPQEALYVGDATVDIEAAKACKMDSVFALYGYHNNTESAKTSGATYLITAMKELLKILSNAES